MDELTGVILVVNVGSSSLKLGLFDGRAEREFAREEVTWGSHQDQDADALRHGIRSLLARHGHMSVAAVGHRVVHGSDRYSASVLIDETVKRDIRDLSALAPLHNPKALAIIEAVEALMPGISQVATFDTAFHATMAPAAYLYPLPYHWYEAWGIRRFGFHGLSHAYCAGRSADLVGRPLDEKRLVVCHLGAGCSLAAIHQGRSVATTMGFTPLDGVPMATRPGTLDPGILLHLLRSGRLSVDEAERALDADSGLRGLSGLTGDMRELLAARTAGNERARLALEIFTARVREGIGALAVALGGL
ncbi:MAG: acetate/propionate family kinase, partial [Chloroflexota bacterium]|nr:acetate/propionate family kinase [Chloroflexota bacterium]